MARLVQVRGGWDAMNLKEFWFATRTMSFLDSHAANPRGVVELGTRPAPRWLVWQPEVIDWIFRSDRHLRHATSRTLSPILGEQSLLWTEGPRHSAYRRVLGPPLARPLAYQPVVSGAVHSAIDALVPGTVFGLPQWTRQLTLRVIAQIVLNGLPDPLLSRFGAWIGEALTSRRRMMVRRSLGRGRAQRDGELEQALLARAKAVEHARPPALAELLVSGEPPLGAVDDDELRDQIVSLLFAGHETTASATAWTLYWLDRHDGIRHDVCSELAATGDDGSDANRVPLLDAVIQEALRLCPPATLTGKRTLASGTELLGTPLPAGSSLTPSIYLAHRSADRFACPHRFDPGRFLDQRLPQAHYFPFGGGTRYCLGRELALMEIRMITAALLRRRTVRCVNPEMGKPRLRGPAMAPDPRLRMEVVA